MPLVYCPECSSTVSDAAASCPACGFPIRGDPDALTQLAAAGRVVNYQSPPRPQSHRTVTTERTGKKWKTQMLGAAAMMFAGVMLGLFGGEVHLTGKLADYGTIIRPAGWLLFVGGLLGWLIARLGAWWNHG